MHVLCHIYKKSRTIFKIYYRLSNLKLKLIVEIGNCLKEKLFIIGSGGILQPDSDKDRQQVAETDSERQRQTVSDRDKQ